MFEVIGEGIASIYGCSSWLAAKLSGKSSRVLTCCKVEVNNTVCPSEFEGPTGPEASQSKAMDLDCTRALPFMWSKKLRDCTRRVELVAVMVIALKNVVICLMVDVVVVIRDGYA